MRADPGYLTEHKIRIFDKAGNEVTRTRSTGIPIEAINYMFRQDPGPTSMLSAWCGSTFPIPMASTCTIRRSRPVRRRFSLRLLRLHPRAGRARLRGLAVEGQPGWDREPHQRVMDSGQQVKVQLTRRSGLLGLYHRMGDAGQRRPVPGRHLPARRSRLGSLRRDGALAAPQERS